MVLTLPDGYLLHAYEVLESTNLETERLARAGAPHGTLVMAASQTGGRGRNGRSWQSLRGNLHLSLLLRPEVPQTRFSELAFVAALSVHGALSPWLEEKIPLYFKWPNDILLENKKLAGMLLATSAGAVETNPAWLVVGIGVNIAHCPEGLEVPVAALHQHLKHTSLPPGAEDVARAWVQAWEKEYTRWQEQGFAQVRERWLDRAKGLGQSVTIRGNGWQKQGIFTGLDKDGRLLLGTAGGAVEAITAGDVFF